MCQSHSTTSRETFRLDAEDLKAVELVDRLLERDLFIEGMRRATLHYGAPPVEILANSFNPDKKQLQAERFQLGLRRYVPSTRTGGMALLGLHALNAI